SNPGADTIASKSRRTHTTGLTADSRGTHRFEARPQSARPDRNSLIQAPGKERAAKLRSRGASAAGLWEGELFDVAFDLNPARSIPRRVSSFFINVSHTKPLRKFSAIKSEIPTSIPITSGSYQFVTGLNASTKP